MLSEWWLSVLGETLQESWQFEKERGELAAVVRKASSEKGDTPVFTFRHSDGEGESKGILDGDSEVSEGLQGKKGSSN